MIEKPIIYTAIFGGKDAIKEPLNPSNKVEYVCFTDNPELNSAVYDIELCQPSTDPNRAAKLFKMFPHKFFPNRVSLYIDGSITTVTDMSSFIDTHIKSTHFALFKNPRRVSVEEEIAYCANNGKESRETLLRQYESYKQVGFPDDKGLVSGGFLLRRSHEEDVIAFNEAWWLEVQMKSRRDEVSFPYVAWKNNFNYSLLPFHSIYNCPDISLARHNY